MSENFKVLMVATSYPRNAFDWQGLFIRKIADAIAADDDVALSLWAPDGPRHANIDYVCNAGDSRWLSSLSRQGGIAHLLRNKPLTGLSNGLGLLHRLSKTYQEHRDRVDLFHINWLQNALPLRKLKVRALITVLGTDFKLLRLPGMVALMRRMLATNQCILAPNAAWMKAPLERYFGDLAKVCPVNFGIDESWYRIRCRTPVAPVHWISVLRLTRAKIGPLFAWGEGLFGAQRRLHLFGPNQEGLSLPGWVDYHGPVTATQLASDWFPGCSGMITLSRHSEGKPQVLLEAMAAGIPIVASDIPAHRECVGPGKNGYLVNSCESFHRALDQVEQPEQHARLSNHCRATTASAYGSWLDCQARYKTLYAALS